MNATIVTNHVKQDAAQIISLTPGLSPVAKRWPDPLAVSIQRLIRALNSASRWKRLKDNLAQARG
jgi:hypothetical protein